MADGTKIMRSQLGRARGLGSAKTGTEHWWIERVTAAALVPLSLWFVFSVLSMLGAEQPVVAAWAARPLNAALLLALILMIFRHAALGLQVVLEDYVQGAALRTASILAVKGTALLLGLMAALAVTKLFLAAH
jgi:succinate dehydrogenase / fumarate reductase membrane anchor subunit